MELISVHVPKTAGVTFRTLLNQVYSPAAVRLDYGDRALDPVSTFQTDPAAWRAESDQQAADQPSAVRVIHGHFNGAKYDTVFPQARKIVWLRDPVSRLVSHYHYWRTLPPSPHTLHRRLLDENLSLLDFARLDGMRNVLARVFLKDCRLGDFAFVGIQEHFAEDVRTLGSLLGWPTEQRVGEENKNPQTGYQQIFLSEISTIKELNSEDIAIYQQALTSRKNMISPRS